MRIIGIISVTAVLLTGLLAGCDASSEPPTNTSPIVASSDDVTLTLTKIALSSTPTLVDIPKTMPSPHGLDYPASEPSATYSASVFPLGDFLFAFETSDCDLPCWNGIKFGVTKIDEARIALIDAYGTPIIEPKRSHAPPGLDALSLSWDLPQDDSYDQFSVGLYFDETNQIVQAENLLWDGSKYLPAISLQSTLRELGKPDSMLILLEGIGQGRAVFIQIILRYDIGISFYYRDDIPYIDIANSETPSKITEFCLNQSYETPIGTVVLTTPYSQSLTSIQKFLLPNDAASMKPILDLTGISLEEITQRAVTEENPCFTFDVRG